MREGEADGDEEGLAADLTDLGRSWRSAEEVDGGLREAKRAEVVEYGRARRKDWRSGVDTLLSMIVCRYRGICEFGRKAASTFS